MGFDRKSLLVCICMVILIVSGAWLVPAIIFGTIGVIAMFKK